MCIVYKGGKDYFCQRRDMCVMKGFKEVLTYLED